MNHKADRRQKKCNYSCRSRFILCHFRKWQSGKINLVNWLSLLRHFEKWLTPLRNFAIDKVKNHHLVSDEDYFGTGDDLVAHNPSPNANDRCCTRTGTVLYGRAEAHKYY